MEHNWEFGEMTNGEKGTFYLSSQGLLGAKVYFVTNPLGHYVLEHTETHPSCKGLGLGSRIIEEIVALARAKRKSVIPNCSFAKRAFEKHPEWADVL